MERKTQSVKLPMPLYKRLRSIADERGTFISRLLKIAVEAYLESTPSRKVV
jgi:predicted DNA-binding protein